MSPKRLPPEFGESDNEKKNASGQRALTRRDFVKIAGAAGAAAAGGLLPAVVSAATPKPKMSVPTIECAGSTSTSINIRVCAADPGTGAPAGFTVQWETVAQYTLDGWGAPEQCGGSFSGNANQSNYTLAPGECVTVNIGDLLFDNGVSTTCPDPLLCQTTYVFRAFAHADATHQRSDFTSTIQCTTLPCTGGPGNCTYTQGYWKTHTPLICDTDPTSPLCVFWPVSSLTLGTVAYDVTQLVSILNAPAQGNGLIALAHQLIAAKLNIANGADGTDAAVCITEADALIDSLVIPPVGGGSLAPSVTSGLVACLTNYNEGVTGPGHCQ